MLASLTAAISTTVLALHGWPLYLVVAALAFGEAAAFIGLVLPGEVAVFIGGALAAAGRVDVWVLVALVAVAAVAGDSVGYEIGRLLGPRMRRSRLGRLVGEARWDRAEAAMSRGGWWTVALGRWVGLLRALVPAVAGAARMPYRRFLAANAVGGSLWAVAVVLLGYSAGAAWQQAQGQLLVVALAGGGVLAAVVAVQLWRARRRRDRGAPVRPEAPRTPVLADAGR